MSKTTELVGPAPKVTEYLIDWRKEGHFYRSTTITAGDRRVQISVSPTGRSVRIFVDGTECKKADYDRS